MELFQCSVTITFLFPLNLCHILLMLTLLFPTAPYITELPSWPFEEQAGTILFSVKVNRMNRCSYYIDWQTNRLDGLAAAVAGGDLVRVNSTFTISHLARSGPSSLKVVGYDCLPTHITLITQITHTHLTHFNLEHEAWMVFANVGNTVYFQQNPNTQKKDQHQQRTTMTA